MRTVVVVPSGEGALWREELDGATVIAADGGLDVCRRMGIRPDLWVGDGDSVSDEALAWAAGVPRDEHPEDKDASDLELALQRAATFGEDVVVLGGFGGRLDHLLINAAVLAARPCRWLGERATVWSVHDAVEVALVAGQVFSLLPWGGTAEVSVSGARWDLERAELSPWSSRGLSNEAKGPVTLTVIRGVVLLITTT